MSILVAAVALTALLLFGGLAAIAFGFVGLLFFGGAGLMPVALAGLVAFGGGLVFATKIVWPALRLAKED